MLLHYLKKLNIQIFCRYSAYTEKNANKFYVYTISPTYDWFFWFSQQYCSTTKIHSQIRQPSNNFSKCLQKFCACQLASEPSYHLILFICMYLMKAHGDYCSRSGCNFCQVHDRTRQGTLGRRPSYLEDEPVENIEHLCLFEYLCTELDTDNELCDSDGTAMPAISTYRHIITTINGSAISLRTNNIGKILAEKHFIWSWVAGPTRCMFAHFVHTLVWRYRKLWQKIDDKFHTYTVYNKNLVHT